MKERRPIPPRILIGELHEDEQRKIIRLALLVVADLAAGRDWAAFEQVEFARLSPELEVAFWSLLDSGQRTTLKSLASCK